MMMRAIEEPKVDAITSDSGYIQRDDVGITLGILPRYSMLILVQGVCFYAKASNG